MRPSPQGKKQLSYARDRRNDYGENDKASRKAIPLHKRKVVRAYRKLTKQQLPKNVHEVAPDEADVIDARVASVRRGEWRKFPDIPLGEFIERQRKRRRIAHRRRASKSDG